MGQRLALFFSWQAWLLSLCVVVAALLFAWLTTVQTAAYQLKTEEFLRSMQEWTQEPPE